MSLALMPCLLVTRSVKLYVAFTRFDRIRTGFVSESRSGIYIVHVYGYIYIYIHTGSIRSY